MPSFGEGQPESGPGHSLGQTAVVVERSSAGDPERTLRLLWLADDPAPRRGPSRTWTVASVIDAAIALADAGGLQALSMRAVAEHVGTRAMSLYTYVPGKAELVDAMLDRVYAGMARAPLEGLTWRDRVRAVADDNMALYAAHPWAAEVSTARPTLGPGTFAKYEHELSAFDGLGMDDRDIDAALTYVLQFTRAAGLAAHAEAVAARESSSSDQEWWAAAAPLLARWVDPDVYPRAVRIGTAAGEAQGSAARAQHLYSFGVARVIDGLAALIDAPGT